VAKADMKNDALKQGDVFYFPYLWKAEAKKGITDSKERTCCLAFNSSPPTGRRYYIIVPISDRNSEAGTSLVVPAFEKQRAGLNPARPAYVHVDEFNFDPTEGSIIRKAKPKVLGRFSKRFTEQIASALAIRIKLKSATGIDRRN
jgi:hypothetical protein